ncbi:NAD(P)H-dependent oxidoreductase [Kribbella sp. NPDC051770]|uniref:NADPH-dependent FMN reductase n=1 Tax=Kribbella sp. NPDC051770 TaxID=3155413 RepID=UPI00342FEC4B
MTVHPLRLAFLVRTTQASPFCRALTAWFAQQVEGRDDFKLDLIDLASTTDLPRRIAEADAYVVLAPEYNHAYPGDLKTAIDSVRHEWFGKPVGFVVYGGRSRGLRAAEQLRLVFGELHTVTVRETLSFQQFPGSDVPEDLEDIATTQAARVLLDQLAWWGRTLRDARSRDPYPV